MISLELDFKPISKAKRDSFSIRPYLVVTTDGAWRIGWTHDRGKTWWMTALNDYPIKNVAAYAELTSEMSATVMDALGIKHKEL